MPLDLSSHTSRCSSIILCTKIDLHDYMQLNFLDIFCLSHMQSFLRLLNASYKGSLSDSLQPFHPKNFQVHAPSPKKFLGPGGGNSIRLWSATRSLMKSFAGKLAESLFANCSSLRMTTATTGSGSKARMGRHPSHFHNF